MESLVQQFNECINSRDLTGLAALISENHSFIDTTDQQVEGKEAVLKAWQSFFSYFPDYRNIFESVVVADGIVSIAGTSKCSDAELEGPTLWCAKITNNEISEWRIYEDNAANREALNLNN